MESTAESVAGFAPGSMGWRPVCAARGSRRRLRRPVADCQGSGTVAGLIAVLVVFVMLGAVSALGSVTVAKAQVDTAADEAALAAAVALRDGASATTACSTAQTVAQRNGAVVQACTAAGDDVTVEARTDVMGLAIAGESLPGISVGASARAGPVGCGG